MSDVTESPQNKRKAIKDFSCPATLFRRHRRHRN